MVPLGGRRVPARSRRLDHHVLAGDAVPGRRDVGGVRGRIAARTRPASSGEGEGLPRSGLMDRGNALYAIV